MHRDSSRFHQFLFVLAVVLLAAFWSLTGSCAGPDGPVTADAPAERVSAEPEREKLVFAETYEYWTAPTLIANLLGLYEQVGLEVRVAKFTSGLEAKNAVLSGSADLGLVAVTPVALAGFQKENITLVSTYVESDDIVKLTARTGGEEVTPRFLEDSRVGYVPGTISELVLERMIDKAGLDRRHIRTASFRPTELVPALATGSIDAFVAWEPLPLLAEHEIEGVRSYLDPTLYTVSLNLVTRPEIVATRSSALEKFLRALDLAIERIEEDPEHARMLVEQHLDFTPGALEKVWGDLHFEVKLDRPALVENLEDEGHWILQAGYARGSLPEYESFVDDTTIRALRAKKGL